MSVDVRKLETDRFHKDKEVGRLTVETGRAEIFPTEPDPDSREPYDSVVILALSKQVGGEIWRAMRDDLPSGKSAERFRQVLRGQGRGIFVDHVMAGEEPIGTSERIYDGQGQPVQTLVFSAPSFARPPEWQE